MIRIAFVLPSFAGGGAERVMITLVNALDRSAFSPRLIVLDGSGPLRGLVGGQVPVTVLGRRRLRAALPRLRRALLAEPTDIALSTIGYLNAGLLSLRPVLPRRLKLLVREANIPLAGTSGRIGWILALAVRYLYPRAERIFCPTQIIADELSSRYKVRTESLCVIPNPVDAVRLRALAHPPRRHPGPGLRLIAAGRLVEQKGHSRLLDLMPALPEDTRLTILGDGPLRGALMKQVAALGLESRVELLGFCEEPWSWFAGADALLLPSLWEGLPNVALEALALGVPVVATPDAGGIIEVDAVAPPGAITITAPGEPMASILRQVTHPLSLDERPSLLPPKFSMQEVLGCYERELMRVFHGSSGSCGRRV